VSEILHDLRADLAERRNPSPRVRHALLESEDPAMLRKAGRIVAGLRRGGCDLPPVRVSVISPATVGPFEHMLRAGLLGAGALPIVDSAAYGAFHMTLAAGGTNGHGAPDVVACVLTAEYFLGRDWDASDPDALAAHMEARFEEFVALVRAGLEQSTATLVLHTVPLPSEVRNGLISWTDRSAISGIWHRLNARMLELARLHRQVVVIDFVSALVDAPFPARDDRLHRYADLPYSDGALLVLARELRRVVQARAGLSRKVLAIDVDDTLWGGAVREVGVEGVLLGGLYPGNCYAGVQRSVQRLQEQGVILVLASKNDPELLEDALRRHPECLLRPEHFSATAVNSSAMSANLRDAASALGLSTASFVFMGDSPFERAEVAAAIPEVAIIPPEGDPARLTGSLLRHGWFDVLELADTDRRRPGLHNACAPRNELPAHVHTAESFLSALDVEVLAEPVRDFTIGRVAQLGRRIDQFNLTGRRHSEAATAAMAADPRWLVVSFSVSDRFGDEGIAGAAWIERAEEAWRVDNLVLSYRVLGRGIEFAISQWLAERAAAAGASVLEGEFVPSGRNRVASTFWSDAGFSRGTRDGIFVCDTTSAVLRTSNWMKLRTKGIE
jgi:FkbH-like protein